MKISEMMPSLDIAPVEPEGSWFRNVKWIAAFALGGALGFALGNGHTTQGAISDVANKYGVAKVAAGCEHKRADKATELALQTQIVDPSQLSPDCPLPTPKPLDPKK